VSHLEGENLVEVGTKLPLKRYFAHWKKMQGKLREKYKNTVVIEAIEQSLTILGGPPSKS